MARPDRNHIFRADLAISQNSFSRALAGTPQKARLVQSAVDEPNLVASGGLLWARVPSGAVDPEVRGLTRASTRLRDAREGAQRLTATESRAWSLTRREEPEERRSISTSSEDATAEATPSSLTHTPLTSSPSLSFAKTAFESLGERPLLMGRPETREAGGRLLGSRAVGSGGRDLLSPA